MTIRYDPRDLVEIRVYHRDEFLCRAVAPDIAAATISMQDLQAARNERRRELREHLTARRAWPSCSTILGRRPPAAPATPVLPRRQRPRRLA